MFRVQKGEKGGFDGGKRGMGGGVNEGMTTTSIKRSFLSVAPLSAGERSSGFGDAVSQVTISLFGERRGFGPE